MVMVESSGMAVEIWLNWKRAIVTKEKLNKKTYFLKLNLKIQELNFYFFFNNWVEDQ